MGSSITLRNRQRRVPVRLDQLRRDASRAYQLVAALPPGHALPETMTVLLVSDRRIAQLHRRYLQISGPTDVITFDHGDLIISVDTAQRQAREYTSTLERELRLYLIHGLLHLIGFDDRTPASLAVMQELQEQLLAQLIAPPSRS